MTKTASSPQRKLAAIMFTDIAGYTAAMSADEESALKTLRKKRSILKPLIIDNNGTFVKEIGDGTLSYFHSAIDAATCAVSLQQATYDDTDMNLRIGVHVGDIVFDDEDVFGDGVNVAARLESMAPVGGVCVSKSVFEELLNKKEFDGVPLGLQQLKGVGRLIDVFALKAKNLIHPDPKEYEEHKVEPHSDDEVPSVAVLPLKNKGKEEDAFYAYGITADLITSISSAGKIRVVSMDDVETIEPTKLSSKEIADKLRVRYVVSGMLWKHENMFQLSIEMNDTKTNSVVWSDRWQEPWDELTSINSNLTDGLIKVLNIGEDMMKVAKPRGASTKAYEYYLRGKYKFDKRENPEDTKIALELLKKSIDLDPDFVLPRMQLGLSLILSSKYELASIALDEALKLAEKNDDEEGQANILRMIGVMYHRSGEGKQAEEYLFRSLTMFRSMDNRQGEGMALGSIGGNYLMQGENAKALPYVRQSLEIARELGDRVFEALCTNHISILLLDSGKKREGMEMTMEALKIAKDINYKPIEAFSLTRMSRYEVEQNNFTKAFDLLDTVEAIWRDLEIHDMEIDIQMRKAAVYSLWKQDYKQAIKIYKRSRSLSQRFELTGKEAFANCMIGINKYRLGEFEKAVEDFDTASDLWRSVDNKQMQLYALSWWALAAMKSGFKKIALTKANKVEKLLAANTPREGDVDVVFWNLAQVFLGLDEVEKSQKYLDIAHETIAKELKEIKDDEECDRYFIESPIAKEVISAWESIEKK